MAGYDYSPRYLNKFRGLPLTDEDQLQYQTPADSMAELPQQVDDLPDPGMQVNTPPSVVDPAVQKREALKTYIMEKYNAAADPAGVDQAKADARAMESSANFQQGLGGLLTAKGQAYGGYRPDWTVQNSLRQTAQQGIKDATTDREQKIQNYLTQNRLQRQGVVEGREDQQYARVNTKGTDEAKLLAAQLNKIAPGSVKDPSAVSLADLENIRKTVEFGANIDNQKTTKRLLAQNIKDKSDLDLIKKEEEMLQRNVNPAGQRAPEMLKKALARIQRAEAAEGLLLPKGQKEMQFTPEGEPIVMENLSPKFVAELANAWAVMINGGGVTSEGQREELLQRSLGSKWADMKAYITGGQYDARLGPYIKEIAKSIYREKNISKNQMRSMQVNSMNLARTIKEKNRPVWDAYVDKLGIKPEWLDQDDNYIPQDIDAPTRQYTPGQKKVDLQGVVWRFVGPKPEDWVEDSNINKTESKLPPAPGYAKRGGF